MVLRIIPFTRVNREQDTGIEQRSYNTNFHGEEEIKAVLPDIEHKAPDAVQPWVLLEPWMDLIIESRRLSEADVHQISLPGSFLSILISTSAIGVYMGRINSSDAEDLEAYFPKVTTRGINISELLQKGRYFVRLNTCSLKDAVVGGKGPVMSVEQLVTRLATSHRGCNGIKSMRDYDMSAPIHLYLFPWDINIRTELEYRVFCPPKAGRIAAISQYKWYESWYHAKESPNEQQNLAEQVVKGAEVLNSQLMVHPAMTEAMRSSGYTFDVAKDPESHVIRLIELNGFGALSGCGSCLFHWINDAQLLYGHREETELRVVC